MIRKVRSLILVGSMLMGLEAFTQRTNTDSLLLAVRAWERDHAPGDTNGLVQMNRLAVIFSMRLEIDRQIDVLDRAVSIAEADRAKLSPSSGAG